jgi:hypothetical protein
MKRIFHVLLVLFIGVMLQSSPSPAANAEGPASTPEVTMRFSSDRILLGEPVWVLVTARNNSGVALEWNPGDYCYMDSQMPVTALGPEAAPGSGKPELCDYGGRGGDCFSGGSTTKIAPGQSATWKYLLEGNFHFTHARIYHLELTSHPGKIFRTVGDKTETAAAPAPIKQTLTLEVLSKFLR